MSLMQKYTEVYKLQPNHSTTTLTTAFRNSGRNQMHAFNARYKRSMHDLDYCKPIQQYVDRSKSKSRSISKQGATQPNPQKISKFRIAAPIKSSSSHRIVRPNPSSSPTHSPTRIDPKSYKISSKVESIPLESRQQQFIRNLQAQKINNDNENQFWKTSNTSFRRNLSYGNISAGNYQLGLYGSRKYRESTFGLSDCQLQNTITGKINKRSSHHIAFSKMPDRPTNINKIWYQKDQLFSPLDRQTPYQNSQKQKIHPFKSDSPHKVFSAAQNLDKYYQITQPIKLVKQRLDVQVREMEKVKPRDGLQVKLGTNLEYEKNRSLQNKKRGIFQLSKIQRKLVFSRQVISPGKGVYR